VTCYAAEVKFRCSAGVTPLQPAETLGFHAGCSGITRDAGRRYPGRAEQAAVAAGLVYFTLFGLHDGNPEEAATARRLAADYRACYGVPLMLPEPAKGAAIPPCWRAAGLDRAGVP
jgi:hypothetical protein